MYKLILNGKLDTKTLNSLDEVLLELSRLNQEQVFSVNWVKI